MKTILLLLISVASFGQIEGTTWTTEGKSRKKDWSEHLYWCVTFEENGVAKFYSRQGTSTGNNSKATYQISGDTITVSKSVDPRTGENPKTVYVIENSGTTLRNIGTKSKWTYRREKEPGTIYAKPKTVK